MTTDALPFEEDPPRAALPEGMHHADELLLNIDGYEGPIDVLLMMARDQKVDLAKISILQLVRQYLAFVDRAKELHLDLAAEYLVMAAWLAYLKSRLLLPREEGAPEPDARTMAEALQFQLRRLEAMQNAAGALFTKPRLGDGIYARGMPEGLKTVNKSVWDVSLYDLLKSYGDIRHRKETSHYELPVFRLMSMEEAVERMTKMLGNLPRSGPWSVWTTLQSFLPEKIKDALYARSSMASIFTASLELVKQGVVEIRQDGLFRPIYLRTLPAQAQSIPPEQTNEETHHADDRATA